MIKEITALARLVMDDPLEAALLIAGRDKMQRMIRITWSSTCWDHPVPEGRGVIILSVQVLEARWRRELLPGNLTEPPTLLPITYR